MIRTAARVPAGVVVVALSLAGVAGAPPAVAGTGGDRDAGAQSVVVAQVVEFGRVGAGAATRAPTPAPTPPLARQRRKKSG